MSAVVTAEPLTRWVPIAWEDLRPGDRVRATRENGDAGLGTVVPDPLALEMDSTVFIYRRPITYWRRDGWSAAIQAPVLPDEPGLYISPGALEGRLGVVNKVGIFSLSPSGEEWATDVTGKWEPIEAERVPGDVVQLVPGNEVDELRDRLEAVRKYARETQAFLLPYEAACHLLALVDGKVQG